MHFHTIRTSYTGAVLLKQKLPQQSYEEERLKITLRKFYGHHHELVDPCDVSVFKLTEVQDLFVLHGLIWKKGRLS